MDPNETLRMIRSIATQITEGPGGVHRVAALAGDLAEYVTALDEWLTKGGFVPTEWDHS